MHTKDDVVPAYTQRKLNLFTNTALTFTTGLGAAFAPPPAPAATPLVAFLALLPAAAGAAPGGAIPGITRFRCTDGANLATGAAAAAVAVAFLGATIFPTGAVSLFMSLERVPVLPVRGNGEKKEEKYKR